MSSNSPPFDEYGSQLGGGTQYEGSQSDTAKSPLSMSLGFLKTLTEKKATRTDGKPPKRRGPKPDSKPALTRRQELNRQAQRTHRERKELYIKALEQEVLRLKENFSSVTRDKQSLAEENRQLKQLLAQNGIPWTGTGGVDELVQNLSVGYTPSESLSGSYAPGSTGYSPPHATTPNYQSMSPPAMNGLQSMAPRNIHQGIDHDQAGIDFVLTLERPCMNHMQILVEGASQPGGHPCGHALMASCPPDPNFDDNSDTLFSNTSHVKGTAQKTWDLSKSDLANLLDLSQRLNLDGEITPVMAWGLLLGDPRFSKLRGEDFEKISQDLMTKIRCYGFGAVLEEFEVRDAVETVFNGVT